MILLFIVQNRKQNFWYQAEFATFAIFTKLNHHNDDNHKPQTFYILNAQKTFSTFKYLFPAW